MLENNEAYEYLLSEAGMQELHGRLVAENDWFIHETPKDNLGIIRLGSLNPHIREDTIHFPSCKTKVITNQTSILCLKPIKSKVSWRNVVGKGKITTALAIHKSYLPTMIGLDFTFPPHWNAFSVYLREKQINNPIDAALKTIYKNGVVISYASIKAEHLRVQLDDNDNPENWPLLIDVPVI